MSVCTCMCVCTKQQQWCYLHISPPRLVSATKKLLLRVQTRPWSADTEATGDALLTTLNMTNKQYL